MGLETIPEQKPNEQNQQQPDPNRPAWLPEKFKTAEDFAAAYKELETKLGSTKKEEPTVDLSTVEGAQAALTNQGLDFKKYSDEYVKNGKLSDASMTELTGKGFTPEQVNQFIDGQKAIAVAAENDVYTSVGGKEHFDKLIEFAKVNLPADERKAFNSAVQSGNYAGLKLILRGINKSYEASLGKEPNLINGGKPSGGTDTFINKAEFHQAMKDPRYNSDVNYRNGVVAKMKRSESLWKWSAS